MENEKDSRVLFLSMPGQLAEYLVHESADRSVYAFLERGRRTRRLQPFRLAPM